MNSICCRIDRLILNSHYTVSVEDQIISVGKTYPKFRQSSETTSTIMKMAKKRCRNIRLITFETFGSSPFYDEFKRISEFNGIDFIDGLPQSITAAQNKGLVVKAGDGAHWSELGHKIAAEQILDYLNKKIFNTFAPGSTSEKPHKISN